MLLGAADGSFAAPVNYTVGEACSPNSVVVGFFNSDKTPDLAVANGGCNNVSVLLGAGDGTFGAPQGFGVDLGVLPTQLATEGASILLGSVDGTFSSAPGVLRLQRRRAPRPCRRGRVNNAGDTPLAVAVGDFNGDTTADLAFADDPSGPNGAISIVLGNGDGTFDQQRVIQYAVGSSTTSVAVGDFNGDTVADLATTDDFGAVWVLPGVGNGTFGTPMSFPVNDAYALAVGDFDANSLPDMAVASPDPNEVWVLLNNTPRSSPGPGMSVAAGGSCTSKGLAGAISLALADGEGPARNSSLSFSSNSPALVPGDAITVGGSGTSRTLTVRPVAGRSGTAVVTVNQLSDGQVTGSVRVAVTVPANGANTVAGGGGADLMFARSGADTLDGGGGNDLLCGGNGPDTLSGGEGDDTLDGGRGPDRLTGGMGADRFAGGQGKDVGVDFNRSEGDSQDGTVP